MNKGSGMKVATKGIVTKIENDHVLVLEQTFNAPRELLFQMFKQPKYLKQWYGTYGWELPVCDIDFRSNGEWHYCMKCVEENHEHYGMESWGKTFFKEIMEPEKIVYIDYFSDPEGNINESMPSPKTTNEFIAMGNKTKIISRSEYDSEKSLQTVLDMGVVEGITQTWDRLNTLVTSLGSE